MFSVKICVNGYSEYIVPVRLFNGNFTAVFTAKLTALFFAIPRGKAALLTMQKIIAANGFAMVHGECCLSRQATPLRMLAVCLGATLAWRCPLLWDRPVYKDH